MLLSYAARTSYVVSQYGRIAFAYSDLDPEGHVSKTLKAFGIGHEKLFQLSARHPPLAETHAGVGQTRTHRLEIIALKGDMVEGACIHTGRAGLAAPCASLVGRLDQMDHRYSAQIKPVAAEREIRARAFGQAQKLDIEISGALALSTADGYMLQGQDRHGQNFFLPRWALNAGWENGIGAALVLPLASALGFFFSRLLRCSPLAMVVVSLFTR